MFPLPLAQVATDLGADLLKQLLAAFNQRNWYLVGVLVIIAVIGGIRKLASRVSFLKFFNTDRGGAILALAMGLVGGVAADAIGGSFHLRAVLDGIVLGFTSAGGYVTVKKLVWPNDITAPPAPVPAPTPAPTPEPTPTPVAPTSGSVA